MSVAFVVLGVLLLLMVGAPGALKLAEQQVMRDSAEHLGIEWPRFRLIGVLEVAAVVGIAIGFAWRPLGVAAGIGVVVLMLGALYFHSRAKDGLPEMGAAIGTLVVAIAYVVAAIAA